MGTSENDSVQCHTDLKLCCSGSHGPHRGDWYFPDGTRLPFFSGVMNERRGAQRVDIHQTKDQLVSIAVIFQLTMSMILIYH